MKTRLQSPVVDAAAHTSGSGHAALARRIDAQLLVECQMEAVNRRLLGEAAKVLLRYRLYRRLGFARVGDYARERLGVAARTVQSAAWLAKRLDELSAVERAFVQSEISWTQARLLCRVASVADQRQWLILARQCTVDDLEQHVRKARGAVGERDPDVDDGEIDDEPAITLRIVCPSRVRALWRRALELASRMMGEPLAAWRGAEAIAAEASSGLPRGALLGDRAASACLDLVRTGTRASAGSPGATAVPSTCARAVKPEPRDPRLALTPADPFAVDARLRFAVDGLHRNEPRIGALLRVIAANRYYRLLGHGSLDADVRERLGISIRKARALLAIEKVTQRSDAFASAYRGGALPWTRALTLLPVVDADTGPAWVARAGAVTVRRLADEVSWVLETRDVCGPGASCAPPPSGAHLTSPFNELGRRVRGQKVSLTLGGDRESAGVQIGARSLSDGAKSAAPELCDADVRFTGPASVVAFFRDVLDAFAVSDAPRWRALERMLFHVIAEWERAPRHRDPVFARDGWRCAVPGCTSRRRLQDHHVRYRGRGGGNEQTNRVAACAAHHRHGIHAGVVRAWGFAPHDVHWELGVRSGAPPLLSYVGDRLCGAVG